MLSLCRKYQTTALILHQEHESSSLGPHFIKCAERPCGFWAAWSPFSLGPLPHGAHSFSEECDACYPIVSRSHTSHTSSEGITELGPSRAEPSRRPPPSPSIWDEAASTLLHGEFTLGRSSSGEGGDATLCSLSGLLEPLHLCCFADTFLGSVSNMSRLIAS